jgi:hypothetical protein
MSLKPGSGRSNGRDSVLAMVVWLTLFFVTTTTLVHGHDVEPTCGDCWCILDGDLTSCPDTHPGIVGSFSSSADRLYSSFELTNADSADFLKLQDSDGSATCFPFVSSVGEQEKYPLSSAPACVKPTSTTNTTVCAYLYEPDSACEGRKYQVVTYESSDAAVAAGAAPVPPGGVLKINPLCRFEFPFSYVQDRLVAPDQIVVPRSHTLSDTTKFLPHSVIHAILVHHSLWYLFQCSRLWSSH